MYLITVKVSLFVAALLAATANLGFAFHDGGVAQCDGCHIMHNSEVGAGVGLSNANLLRAESPSSLCLNCHEDEVITTSVVSTPSSLLGGGQPPITLTPGGDFGWLKKNYTWLSGATQLTEDGEIHGHNIIATDYGFQPDGNNTAAPGGSYPADQLHCTSCHDPHGRYRILPDGNVATTGLPIRASGSSTSAGLFVLPVPGHSAVGSYRLLAGVGYEPKSGPSAPFVNDPPAAISPELYNRREDVTQTRVAYGKGMSEWCLNCHSQIHAAGSGGSFIHNAGDLATFQSAVVDRYNSYIKTGDLSGTASNSYLSLVPFEMGLGNSIDDLIALAEFARTDDTNLAGPDSNSRVMCLSCHRAHASGWRYSLRWNNEAEFIVYNSVFPGLDNGAPTEYAMGRLEIETRKAYYDRDPTIFADNQNRLCEKCHIGSMGGGGGSP